MKAACLGRIHGFGLRVRRFGGSAVCGGAALLFQLFPQIKRNLGIRLVQDVVDAPLAALAEQGNLERTPILICSVLLQKWCKRNRSFRTSRALHSKGDFLIEDSAPILAGAKWVPVEHTDLAWTGGLFTGVQQGNQGSGKYFAGLGAVDIETRASLGIIAMDRLKEVLGRCCILRGEREADRKTSRQAASKTGGRERTRIEPLRKLTERSATDSMPERSSEIRAPGFRPAAAVLGRF